MRMYGAPTGYEFVGLVEAVLIAGTGKVDLERRNTGTHRDG